MVNFMLRYAISMRCVQNRKIYDITFNRVSVFVGAVTKGYSCLGGYSYSHMYCVRYQTNLDIVDKLHIPYVLLICYSL